jgi:adenylate kinase
MNLIFLGAPGSGKGTQAEFVSEKMGIPPISTGNMLREAVKNGTEAGLSAKKFMDAGDLVPDEVVIGIIKDRVAMDDAKNGFILDGFPRTTQQAKALEEMGVKIDLAVEIYVPHERIVSRMSGRRVCDKCGTSYHTEFKPTKADGKCDACDGSAVQRDDDKPETVISRLKTYEEKTAPLRDFYAMRDKLEIVAGRMEIEETKRLTFKAIGC